MYHYSIWRPPYLELLVSASLLICLRWHKAVRPTKACDPSIVKKMREWALAEQVEMSLHASAQMLQGHHLVVETWKLKTEVAFDFLSRLKNPILAQKLCD